MNGCRKDYEWMKKGKQDYEWTQQYTWKTKNGINTNTHRNLTTRPPHPLSSPSFLLSFLLTAPGMMTRDRPPDPLRNHKVASTRPCLTPPRFQSLNVPLGNSRHTPSKLLHVPRSSPLPPRRRMCAALGTRVPLMRSPC